ncbi:MAG: hypothetical protein P8H45_01505 [Flavobacteriaceae bacterium]|nr:hypothetical protein [Flavobacteriaceae bacterium]
MDTLDFGGSQSLAYYRKEDLFQESVVASCDYCTSFYLDGSILIFENESIPEKLIVWRLNGEFNSYLHFFVIDEDVNFHKLGEINLGYICDKCDVFRVPDEIMEVSKDSLGFEILFRGTTFFLIQDSIQTKKGGRIEGKNMQIRFYW